MQKGQLSIDLIIALIATITIVVSLSTIILTYSESNERSIIQQQIQYNANKAASIITTSQALDDTNFTIKLNIEKIYYTDQNKLGKIVYPTITNYPTENKINYSIIINGQKQDANSNYYTNSKTTIDTTTLGKLVIKNAS